ncbi:MAG: DUF1016 family protein [Clostridia bacterium]|nr:DUF1016 family protein [Clostridia bacterium]
MELEKLYSDILQQAVAEIRTARNTIARQINATTISVYWNLGKVLSDKKIAEVYGAGVVERLSIDLKIEFPDMGLSPRGLWDMKRFYVRYREVNEKLQRSVAVLPWRHNLLLKTTPLFKVIRISKDQEMQQGKDLLWV